MKPKPVEEIDITKLLNHFERWWKDEGSLYADYDYKAVCKIAWLNGAYVITNHTSKCFTNLAGLDVKR